jgi:hypothetical protein
MKCVLFSLLAIVSSFTQEYDVHKHLLPDNYSTYLADKMKKMESEKERYEKDSNMFWFVLGQQWAYTNALRNYFDIRAGYPARD